METRQLTKIESKIIDVLREKVKYETFNIKKNHHGAFLRVTIHRENDIIMDDNLSERDDRE